MVVRKTSGKYGDSAVRVRQSDQEGWQNCKHVAVLLHTPLQKYHTPTTLLGSKKQTATWIPALITGSTGTELLDDTLQRRSISYFCRTQHPNAWNRIHNDYFAGCPMSNGAYQLMYTRNHPSLDRTDRKDCLCKSAAKAHHRCPSRHGLY